ncbi:MAG: hypothetical protein ABSG86_11605 [Thermoguttaceae bacterium]|jgi:hypothetical protein
MPGTPLWPEGKQFAFTVFDDTDGATLENVSAVYALLAECGFRTTKSCWPLRGDPRLGKHPGETGEDPRYVAWLLDLQAKGFEIGWHGATWHGVRREETCRALQAFGRIFQHPPATGTNHANSEDSIYFGAARLSGLYAFFYNCLTRFHHWKRFRGHVAGDEYFWGDLCRQYVRYYRNFVFQNINTLKRCRFMPYHDPRRPYVNYWFASSAGHNVPTFLACLSEANQDQLEAEGGACIMYTHFARGFQVAGRVEPRFEGLMRRLAAKNGWFVPVRTLLDRLLEVQGHHDITDSERRRLERRWLMEKLTQGST